MLVAVPVRVIWPSRVGSAGLIDFRVTWESAPLAPRRARRMAPARSRGRRREGRAGVSNVPHHLSCRAPSPANPKSGVQMRTSANAGLARRIALPRAALTDRPVADRLGALFAEQGQRAAPGRRQRPRRAARDARPRPRLHHVGAAGRGREAAPGVSPAVWTIGKEFGTHRVPGPRRGVSWVIEVTTYRSDAYARHQSETGRRVRRQPGRRPGSPRTSPSTRWPSRCRSRQFHDPYGGLATSLGR